MKKKEQRGKRLWIGVCTAMPLMTAMLCLGAAKLILSEAVPESAAQIMVGIITGMIAAVLSVFVTIKTKQKKFVWGMGTTGIYFMMLLILNLLFFGNGFKGVALIAGTVFAGGILGSLLGAGKKRRHA